MNRACWKNVVPLPGTILHLHTIYLNYVLHLRSVNFYVGQLYIVQTSAILLTQLLLMVHVATTVGDDRVTV